MKDEHKLSSGAVLVLNTAPFADSRELYKIISKELVNISLDPREAVDANFWKGIACTLLASTEYEEALWKCFARCIYNGEKINENSFEDEKCREDYLDVCYLVSRKNILPFTTTLMQRYSELLGELMSKSQA